MAVDDNNPNVNFDTFSALGGIPVTGTVVTPPSPVTKTNVDPPAVAQTNVAPPAQGIPASSPNGEMNGQGGVVSTPTSFTGGGAGAGAGSGAGFDPTLGTGKPGSSFNGGSISATGGGIPMSGGGGAKVGLDGGGTTTSGFGQAFDDGGAVQPDEEDSSGPPLSDNIDDRRGPLDENGSPISGTNNSATPKANGPADALDRVGIKPAASVSQDWVSSALNMVDKAVQWGRSQYFGNGAPKQGMPTSDPSADPAQGFANGGAVKAYEDGGAVDDDEPQAAAPQQDDPGDQGEPGDSQFPADAGTEPSPQPQQQQGYAMHNPDGSPVQPQKVDVMGALRTGLDRVKQGSMASGNSDKIKSYLIGLMPDGSPVDPQQATAAEQQTGQKDPGDATLAAIGQQQDPKSGWSLIQHDRRQHGLYQAFAQAALDQGHLPAAAKAATQMMDNVPDGMHYDFTPGPHGVMASLSKSGGGPVVATKPMNTFQFQQFLKNPTMFDQALDNGGYSLINQATQVKAQDQAPGAPASGDSAVTAGGKSDKPETPSNRQVNLATQPYGQNGDRSLPNARAGEEDMDPQILRRANSLFPSVGQAQQRSAWIDKMTQQGVSNTQAQSKIDTGVMGKQIAANASTQNTKTKADAGTTQAGIKAEGGLAVAKEKTLGYNQAWATRANAQLQASLAKTNQQAMDASMKESMNGLKTLLTAASQGTDVNDALKQYEPIMKRLGIQPPQQVPQVGAQQPQQQQQQQQPAGSQAGGTVTIGGKQMTRDQAMQLYKQQFPDQ